MSCWRPKCWLLQKWTWQSSSEGLISPYDLVKEHSSEDSQTFRNREIQLVHRPQNWTGINSWWPLKWLFWRPLATSITSRGVWILNFYFQIIWWKIASKTANFHPKLVMGVLLVAILPKVTKLMLMYFKVIIGLIKKLIYNPGSILFHSLIWTYHCT